MSEDMRPKVGVGVAVVKNGKVLLGQRVSEHGEGSWCFPGGHLEHKESWEEAAIREVKEESGLEIANVRHHATTNDIFEDTNKHYITIYMIADWDSGEPQVLEPDKMVKWEWFDWDKLPSPMFLPMTNFIKTGWKP